MSSPEELTRQNIDALLAKCGWMLQNRTTINLDAARGVAIREGLLKGGEADYLLFADRKAIGTIEAKPEGFTLVGVEEQSGKYGKGLLDIYPKWRDPLPFAYESTGIETRFTNRLNSNPSSRDVFAFHTPETLLEWAQHEQQLSGRLSDLMKFTELYNVQHLTSNKLDAVCRVTICTIQRLYAMLRGEELNEEIDEKSGFELAAADQRQRDVQYNAAIPIETFDFIIADTARRKPSFQSNNTLAEPASAG